MTFQVKPRSPGGADSDWCNPIATSARVMRFHHPRSCADSLLVIRRVRGLRTLDPHPEC